MMGSGPADAQENNNNNIKQSNSYTNIIILLDTKLKTMCLIFGTLCIISYYTIHQNDKDPSGVAWVNGIRRNNYIIIFIVYFMYEQFEMHDDYISHPWITTPRPTQERPTTLTGRNVPYCI